MADKAFPIIPRDGTITITDGAGTPLSFEVQYEDGDFASPEMSEGGREVLEFEDRGDLASARRAGRKSGDFSFSCHALRFKREGSGNTHILDVVRKVAAWAAAASTGAAYTDAWCVTVTFTAARAALGESTDSTIVMKYCHLKAAFQEGVPGKISISGRLLAFADDYLTVT